MTAKFDERLQNKEEIAPAALENSGRRKVVKTIVGGVTAIAAYNVLPVRWGTPIIESVFLPAHAATSGEVESPTTSTPDSGPVTISIGDPCEVTITNITPQIFFTVSGFVVPAVSGLPVDISIVTTGGAFAGTDNHPSSTTGLVTDANGEFSINFGDWDEGTTRIDATTTVQGASGSATCGADIPGEPPVQDD